MARAVVCCFGAGGVGGVADWEEGGEVVVVILVVRGATAELGVAAGYFVVGGGLLLGRDVGRDAGGWE